MKLLDTIVEVERFEIDEQNTNPFRVLGREQNELKAIYFSLPIYNQKTKKLIESKWEFSGKKQFFNGINVHLEREEKTVVFANEFGRVEVQFKEFAELSPTYNGIAVSCNNASFQFQLTFDESYFVRENEKCIAFMRTDFTPFLVIGGIIAKRENQVYPLKMQSLRKNDHEYDIVVQCDEKAEDMLFEMNLQSPKLFFDTTVESKNPDRNNAFGPVAFIGNSPYFGEQRLYSRMDLMQFIDLSEYEVIKANLYLPVYYSGDIQLKAYKMRLPWCSFGSTWNTKIESDPVFQKVQSFKQFEKVDITDSMKEILKIQEPTNAGLLIQGENSNFTVVSTGDNYRDLQMIEIHLKSRNCA